MFLFIRYPLIVHITYIKLLFLLLCTDQIIYPCRVKDNVFNVPGFLSGQDSLDDLIGRLEVASRHQMLEAMLEEHVDRLEKTRRKSSWPFWPLTLFTSSRLVITDDVILLWIQDIFAYEFRDFLLVSSPGSWIVHFWNFFLK